MKRKTITIEEVTRTYDEFDNVTSETRRPLSVTEVTQQPAAESRILPMNNLKD